MCAFSATLTTTAHSPQQLAVVGTSPCAGGPGGPASITSAAPHPEELRLHRNLPQRSWHTVIRIPHEPVVGQTEATALHPLVGSRMRAAGSLGDVLVQDRQGHIAEQRSKNR